MNWLIYILAASIVIYLGTIAVYYFVQERFLFVAKPLSNNYKFKISDDYDEYFLNSRDNGIINAIHIKGEAPKGLIIYFHGNTGSLKRWSQISPDLTSHGYDVLMFDYRGFGKSKGVRNEENMHYDAKIVFELASSLYPDEDIILYGRSMGSGMAIKLATEMNVSKLFLETPYHSMLEVAQFHVPFLPIKWLLRFNFKSHQWIQSVKCPIYIFHGTKDRIIPYSHALKLFDLIKSDPRNKMVTIPRGRHSNLNSFPLFREKMRHFFHNDRTNMHSIPDFQKIS